MEPVTPSTIHFRISIFDFGFSFFKACPKRGRGINNLVANRICVLLLNQAPGQITLRTHDLPELLQVFVDRTTDNSVAVIAPEFHFTRRGGETRFDLLCRFGSTLEQATAQFFVIGWHDKYVAQRFANEWIVAIANGGCALRVDVD